jgi:hypothetical protein
VRGQEGREKESGGTRRTRQTGRSAFAWNNKLTSFFGVEVLGDRTWSEVRRERERGRLDDASEFQDSK